MGEPMAGKHTGRRWYKVSADGVTEQIKDPEKDDPIRKDPAYIRAYSTQGAIIKHSARVIQKLVTHDSYSAAIKSLDAQIDSLVMP